MSRLIQYKVVPHPLINIPDVLKCEGGGVGREFRKAMVMVVNHLDPFWSEGFGPDVSGETLPTHADNDMGYPLLSAHLLSHRAGSLVGVVVSPQSKVHFVFLSKSRDDATFELGPL